MLISRRSGLRILLGTGLAGTEGLQRLAARPALFEVDRLAEAFPQRAGGPQRVNVWQRRYRASATVTLLSIPVFNRNDVGTGFTIIEDAPGGNASGCTTAIQFGAGSWPETAHGLNRLGYIQEVVLENRPGELAECAYFAFMTSSQEKNLDQARKALQTSGAEIPYAAAEGIGKEGAFKSRLDRVAFPSSLTWRDYPVLIGKVRNAVSSESPAETKEKHFGANRQIPATFLYATRRALLAPETNTTGTLIYNGKEFELRTEKETDAAMGERFVTRGLVKTADSVVRLNATLHESATGIVTPFHIWYARGEEHMPPLRFDYQARSFLRLAFEYDPAASGPPLVPSLAAGVNDSAALTGKRRKEIA